jgi:hypothetical protein
MRGKGSMLQILAHKINLFISVPAPGYGARNVGYDRYPRSHLFAAGNAVGADIVVQVRDAK